ncbi:transposon Ty3-I Gag-Pol polyprotein [Trichonephila clavata]|uniref:Transposon Ty3-I Gag-Pol polyprotein n=1 Tax=Trichonephila clavata TaxID=2740835 RepID=A0A8X6KRP0_TRICU|nr:transposon Ty3-I Gag-Pol polyprotein [Trichonephila clavata]
MGSKFLSSNPVIPKGVNITCLTNIEKDATCSLRNNGGGFQGHRARTRITREKLKGLLDAELTSIENQLSNLLLEFGDIFDFNVNLGKSKKNAVKHKIDTVGSFPIKQRPYHISATERRVIENEVPWMLKVDVIQPSESP